MEKQDVAKPGTLLKDGCTGGSATGTLHLLCLRVSQNSYWLNLAIEQGTDGQMLHINLLRAANIIGH